MKLSPPNVMANPALSPPSRGAWIEITGKCVTKFYRRVAPLAGGVECNKVNHALLITDYLSPPSRGGVV